MKKTLETQQVYLFCWDDGLQQVGSAAFLSGVPGTEQKIRVIFGVALVDTLSFEQKHVYIYCMHGCS